MNPTERIRALNDQLRVNGIGGRIVMTVGISGLPEERLRRTLMAIQSFSDFTNDNDPHGEHDFGIVEVAGERIMFKIDYYDLAMSGHSPDAADPAVTVRVLTILLASEY
jgi:hypothetical protein